MWRGILLLTFCLFSHLCTLYAGKPNIINFSRDTYRAANKNWCIACDSQGMVYFANDNGLLEFDGINWRLNTITHRNMIRSVAVGSSGEIYTGGYEEFGVWAREVSGQLSYRKLSSGIDPEIIRNNDFWRIIIRDGNIYFQSFNKVFRYYEGAITEISPSGGLLFLMPTCFGLWAQNIHGPMMELSGDKFKSIPGSDFFAETDVQFVLPMDHHRILVGTSTMGIYIYNGQNFTKWDSEFTSSAIRYRLNRGIRLKSGNYLFGTILDGIYEVAPAGKIINHFSTDNYLQNNTVLSLMEDTYGNVWAALDRGISYISYINGGDCHTDSKGHMGAVYTAAVFAGKLFLGTNQGLYHIPIDKLSQSNSLYHLSIIEGTQGQVWDLNVWKGKLLCGHNSGMMVIGSDLRMTKVSSLKTGVYDIHIASHKGKEYILLGTYNSLAALNTDLSPIDDLYNLREPISSIYIDGMSDIWCQSAAKGVYRFRFDETDDHIRYCSSFSHGSDQQLPTSLKLFGINGRAIFYGDGGFYLYDYVNNLLAPSLQMNECFKGISPIRQIVRLSQTRYMALTDRASYTFVPQDRQASIVGRDHIEMSNISMVNHYENAVPLNDSLCLICLDNGFIIKDTRASHDRSINPDEPFLRSVTAMSDDGRHRYYSPSDDRIKISHRFNTIHFSFGVIGALPGNLSFQYKLEGIDTQWSEPVRMDEVKFGRLPEGDYKFLLRATDNLGNYSPIKSFAFTIRPPWNQSVPAYFIYFIFIVGIALLSWRLILRRYHKAFLLKMRMKEEQRLKNQNYDLQVELRRKDAELFSKTSFIMQKNDMIQQIKHELDELYADYKNNALLRQAYLRINSMLNRNLNADEDWKIFLMQFERTNSGFFKRLKEIAPNLSPGDLKIAACLRLNLTSKEIASLMSVSTRAVENSRYLLRKKLDIPPSVNLNEFFINL